MRQAGRYLPEYQALRKRFSFVEMVHTPELACDVTLQPLQRFGFDAAILYSDILVVPEFFGLTFEFIEGRGPVLCEDNLNFDTCVARCLDPIDPHTLDCVYAAIDRIKADPRAAQVPLIGFAGSPFTVACYLIEKGSSKTFSSVFEQLHTQPATFERLLDRLTDATLFYLKKQHEHGVSAIQLFDTWGSILTDEQYQQFSLPYIARLVHGLSETGIPLIVYSKNTSHLLKQLAPLPIQVVGVHWESDMAALKTAYPHLVLQGNLDPHLLLRSKSAALDACKRLCDSMANQPGFIFNLGHGILPQTPLDHVEAIVQHVQQR